MAQTAAVRGRRTPGESPASPVISVSVICFNQKSFITETLNGILSQETEFSFEIIVSDDHSTDGTREIVADFAKKFPSLIRANLNSENEGMAANFLGNLNRCRGNLIALCDGDDLWTSPQKLQLQADFLLANENYTSVFHRVSHEIGFGEFLQELPQPYMRKPRSTVSDLLREESFMPSSSIMFRRPAEGGWPKWFQRLENIVDLPINMFNALHGDIGYIDQNMGIYRTASSPTAFSSRSAELIFEESFRMYELMIENFPDEISSALRENQARALRKIFLFHARKQNRGGALEARKRLRRFEATHSLPGTAASDLLFEAICWLMIFKLSRPGVWLARKYSS